jgi:putative endonuclease
MKNKYYVYILTNYTNSTLYIGVTNNLAKRTYEHKNKLVDSFTKKYNMTKLVYFEVFDDIENALVREKQLKAGSRKKKLDLINQINSQFEDLYENIL